MKVSLHGIVRCIFLKKKKDHISPENCLLDLLRKEVDKVRMSQYIGIECDSDEEMTEDETYSEQYSDDEATRKVLDYDKSIQVDMEC